MYHLIYFIKRIDYLGTLHIVSILSADHFHLCHHSSSYLAHIDTRQFSETVHIDSVCLLGVRCILCWDRLARSSLEVQFRSRFSYVVMFYVWCTVIYVRHVKPHSTTNWSDNLPSITYLQSQVRLLPR